jgi:aspartate racemase
MKTVGIIGGVGPETTSEFYLEVIFGCQQKNTLQRPPILIWNIPLLYQIEEELLLKSSGEDRYIPYLVEAAKKLEYAGTDFLVMPCNTLHIFIENIREAVNIPILSIVDETAKFLAERKIRKVGMLATPSSLKHNLYAATLQEFGIEQILPDKFEEAKIGKMINNIVLNRHANRDREDLLKVIKNFEKKDVQTVILACTDLQLLIPAQSGIDIFDTMKIFADATVETILEDT